MAVFNVCVKTKGDGDNKKKPAYRKIAGFPALRIGQGR